MSRVRVAFIGPNLAFGGVTRWLISLHRWLPAWCESTAVLQLSPPPDAPEESRAKWPLSDQLTVQQLRHLTHVEERVDNLAAWLQDHLAEIDALVAWGSTRFLEPLQLNKPVVFAHHVARQRFQLPDCCTHAACVAAHMLENLHGRAARHVIANGVEFDRLAGPDTTEVRDEFCLDRHHRVLGYCGRLSDGKGLDYWLKTLGALPDNYRGLIQGRGLKGELGSLDFEYLRHRHAPGRCIISYDDNALGAFYQAVDALWVPGMEEGQPFVVLEAMACGTAVMAPRARWSHELQDSHQLAFAYRYNPQQSPELLAAEIDEEWWRYKSWRRDPQSERNRHRIWTHYNAHRMATDWAELFRAAARGETPRFSERSADGG